MKPLGLSREASPARPRRDERNVQGGGGGCGGEGGSLDEGWGQGSGGVTKCLLGGRGGGGGGVLSVDRSVLRGTGGPRWPACDVDQIVGQTVLDVLCPPWRMTTQNTS